MKASQHSPTRESQSPQHAGANEEATKNPISAVRRHSHSFQGVGLGSTTDSLPGVDRFRVSHPSYKLCYGPILTLNEHNSWRWCVKPKLDLLRMTCIVDYKIIMFNQPMVFQLHDPQMQSGLEVQLSSVGPFRCRAKAGLRSCLQSQEQG